MKKIVLMTGIILLFQTGQAQNGNMRHHIPKQKLKSELADSMRRMGMGQAPDTTKDLMYNDRGPKIDIEKAPASRPAGKRAR